MDFGLVPAIQVEDETTWKGKVFLTVDLDWCSDEILSFALDLVEKADLPVTWFVTHPTPLLDRLRRNPTASVGIHPNFNPLLSGDFKYGKDFREVIDFYLRVVPEARVYRSHCLTDSSPIQEYCNQRGLAYNCNPFIPFGSNIAPRPWRTAPGGPVKVPHHWADDVSLVFGWKESPERYTSRDHLNVFNFHPIHIFLNTEAQDRYESTRPLHHDILKLRKYVYRGVGVRNFFESLLEQGSNSPTKSRSRESS